MCRAGADVAELVYAADLKSAAFGITGSSPVVRTKVFMRSVNAA